MPAITRSTRPALAGSWIAFIVVHILDIVLAGLAGWALLASLRPPVSTPAPAATSIRPPYDPSLTSRAIAVFSARVRSDRQDWLSRSILAGDYLQRCRETGDIADAVRAEQMARQSLAIFSRANEGARAQLASSLLTQHRFGEALATLAPSAHNSPAPGAVTRRSGVRAASASASGAAESPQVHLLRAEITMEMGDYDESAQELTLSRQQEVGPNTLALRARLLEINGHPDQALQLLRQAQDMADANLDMPAANVAWFHMRVGNILADMGRAKEAEAVYRGAVAVFPTDYRTLASLTKLAAGGGDWQAALDWATRSANVVPTPEVVALEGDAYSALGKPAAAEEQYRLVDTIGRLARAQGAIYDRQRALFCADHNRDLDSALVLARRELTVRHDIYAYDTLAWVCTRKGLRDEARAASARALSHGTQDARILYHAGRCALADGDLPRARTLLSRALQINPYFLPFAPAEARTLIARMDKP